MAGASVTQELTRAVTDADKPVSPAELAELISAFNDVTSNLSATHESLRGEVTRLEGELRDAKRQLARTQQLAALGEMAAGIAHEIRNPLGSIRLYASILREDLGDRPEERGIAQKIESAVTGLDAVVNDVLVFSRRTDPRTELVDAHELIEKALCACADVLSDVEIAREIPVDACVSCDPALIQQALVNVIRNACEAMSGAEGAALTIRVGQRRALDAEGRRRAMTSISVIDRGPGVEAEVLERAFNPFFTTRHTGTGLGLAIVHRIVDAHLGRVVMANNSEHATDGARGLTVEFLIPTPGTDTQHTSDAGVATEARTP